MEQPTESEPAEAQRQQRLQVALHQIDKLYSAYLEGAAGIKRASYLLAGLTLLILALSSGAASTREELTFAGIGLRLPFAVFMSSCAVLISFLVLAKTALENAQVARRYLIDDLYESIGVDSAYLEKQHPFLFMTGNLVDAVTNQSAVNRYFSDTETQPTSKFFAWYTFSLYILLPTAAQAAAGFKVSELLQSQRLGWTWIIFVCLIVSTYFAWFRQMSHGHATDPVVPNTDPVDPKIAFVMLLFLSIPWSGVSVGLGYFVARVLGSL